MARPSARIRALEVGLTVALAAVVVRAAQVQLLQGKVWAARADSTRTAIVQLPARRGTIYDRTGIPLAVTQESYHVGVAPNEVLDRTRVMRTLATQLDLPPAQIARAFASGRPWLPFRGPFTATQVAPLRALRGVHLEPEYRRFHPSGPLARPIIGALGAEGRGISGLELAVDSLLTGEPGEAVVLRDSRGRRYESPARRRRAPVPGYDVTLTLDAELQDIAERSLDDALTDLEAEGGDVVLLDPRTGEILALASRARGSETARAGTIIDAFEPGSTAKLFTAAALLAHRLVDSGAAVSGEGGRWRMPLKDNPLGPADYRDIEDTHRESGPLTLARAIQVSSNIAMSKFSAELSVERQFEMLRAFGFGSPTGIEYPSESRGHLAYPHRWTAYSRAGLVMGYEFAVTPVQLAAAYAAIANDGILLTPSLVREVRDARGGVRYRHRPEPVRRAVSPEVAATLRSFLRGAVGDGGTGARAQLANFQILGKTGTARRFEDGSYRAGSYIASFAAIFPADDPQLVVIVKLDSPRGGRGYYGSQTAAPVTRALVEQALASRRVALDRGRMVRPTAEATEPQPGSTPEPEPAVVIAWPPAAPPAPSDTDRLVPRVAGLSVRAASLALHRRGLHVAVRGSGRVIRSDPAAGSSARAGATVTLWAE